MPSVLCVWWVSQLAQKAWKLYYITILVAKMMMNSKSILYVECVIIKKNLSRFKRTLIHLSLKITVYNGNCKVFINHIFFTHTYPVLYNFASLTTYQVGPRQPIFLLTYFNFSWEVEFSINSIRYSRAKTARNNVYEVCRINKSNSIL